MDAEAAVFKALAEPTRLRLLVLLCEHGEACVCKLAEALETSDFNISRHLGVLRAAGLVEARREGTWMHYSLVEPRNALERCLHECFGDCLRDHPVAIADFGRLTQAVCRGEERAASPAEMAQQRARQHEAGALR